MEAQQINLLLADDHSMMMNALGQALSDHANLNVLTTCSDGNKALHYLNGHWQNIHVAVLDINMPNLDGIATTPIIKSRYPAIKVIILSMYYTSQIIDKVKSSGADAFIHKADEIEKLAEAIHQVNTGKKVFPNYDLADKSYTHEIAEDAFMKIAFLTEREKQIARYIQQGLTTPKIAALLFLSEYTIDTHRKNILHKLSLKSTAELIKFATENKL